MTETQKDPGSSGLSTEGFIIYELWSRAHPSCDDHISVKELRVLGD